MTAAVLYGFSKCLFQDRASCFCFTSPFGRLRSGSPFSHGAAIGYRDPRLVLEAGGIAFVAFSVFALLNKERVGDAGS